MKPTKLTKRRFHRPSTPSGECRAHVHFSLANTPYAVPHALGYVPTQFHVVSATGFAAGAVVAPGVIYGDTPMAATKHSIQLRCSVAGTDAEIVVK